MGSIEVHWKEATPRDLIITNIHQDTEILSNKLWLLDLTDAEKISVKHQVGHTRNAHFFVVPKRRIHNGIDQISKLLLSVDSNQSLKNKKIDELCKI